MSTKISKLHGAASAAAEKARLIAEAADTAGRQLTDAEKSDYAREMNTARDLLGQLKVAKEDAAILDDARALANEIGGPAAADNEGHKDAGDVQRLKNLGWEIVGAAQFKAAMRPFGGHVPEKARFQTDPISVKSLFTGGANDSAGVFVTAEDSGIYEGLGRRPLTIRDLISKRTTGSDTVEYVRALAHTNAAAPVAEATSSAGPTSGAEAGALVNAVGGGYKPEGAWTYERVSATVKTIAEWVPATKRALADAGQLAGLINDELRADIAEAEEDQIINGDGTGENLPGLLSTSGLQTQAFDTDIFVTVRKALTKARTVGRVLPNGVLLNPTDVETIDLAREAGTTGKFLSGGPFSTGPRTLWGVPVVESEAIAAGSGLVGDFSKSVLWDREQTTVTMTDSHADFFIRNMVAVLAEERVAFGQTRPTALVKTTVAA